MELMDEINKSYVRQLLEKGERLDKRGMLDYRSIEVKTSVIETAEGSAWVKLGKTQVLVAIKFDLVKPFPDRPDEGVLSTSAELLPLASSMFEPGPPDENGIELARVVDRAIRSAEIIDMKSLYVEGDLAYGLYVDIYVLDYDGNLTDASSLAAMAALRNTKMPAYKDGALDRSAPGKQLELKGDALEVTFAKVGDHIFVDPVLTEERAMDARLTIGVCGDRLCAMQKSGSGVFKRAEIEWMIDSALTKYAELRSHLG